MCALEVSKCWGSAVGSGTAAADSESEGIWAMMATALGGEGGSENGARYHLIRVIIGMEGNAHHTGWNGMERARGAENNAKTGEIRGRGRSGNCGTTTDTLFPQLVMM